MNARLVVLLALGVAHSSLYAVDIYRWVDELGRVHFSDAVPDQYKGTATKTNSRQFELTPEQRREVQERATRDKAVTASQKSEPKPLKPKEPSASPTKASTPESASQDCATRQRLYRESQECFAPYRLAGGGIKPEAFGRCVEVKDPSAQCGQMPPYPDVSTAR